jgi:type IV pilus assembly protein PilB
MRSTGSGRRARDTGTTMAKRQNIGQILMGFGKLTEEDMNRALDYQKENGGYFGEALLALDLVNREELEWSLASQFDLPYVFPDAESVDPDAVALVSPEWALSHRILPIMKTADSVTVIMDSPLKSEPIEELRKRTGLEVELALASSERIRELIREVYARAGAEPDPPEARGPTSLAELFGVALEHGAPRMGVSARGTRGMGWYEIRGRVRRRLLTSGWREDLEALLDPPPSEGAPEAPGRWTAQMSQGGVRRPVEARYLASSGGMEYLFRPEEEGAGLRERFPPPARGTLEEIRLLVRSGSGRFAVTGEPTHLAGEILPYLPSLLLESGARSVHLAPGGEAPDDVFAVEVASGSDEGREALRDLRTFHFDAVTADLEGHVGEWAGDVLDLAAAAFLHWPGEVDGRVIEDTGIRWRIHVARTNGERLDWSLTPMKG